LEGLWFKAYPSTNKLGMMVHVSCPSYRGGYRCEEYGLRTKTLPEKAKGAGGPTQLVAHTRP
jgi:hypothetical protein